MEKQQKKEYGPISWDDDTNFGGKNEKTTKTDFLKLEEGSNIVRVITAPYQYLVHKGVKAEGTPGFGRKVPCSMAHGSCPLCAAGLATSPRYYLGVINRQKDCYQVLDVSWTTLQDIKEFTNDKIWGPVETYDLNIVKNPKDPKKYYRVKANPHTPLSPSDLKMKNDADLAELEYKSTPLQPEVVQKIMDKALQGGKLHIPPAKESKFAKPALKVATNGKAAPVVDLSSNDDVSDIFPPYDSTESETV